MQPTLIDCKGRFTLYVVTLGREGDLEFLKSAAIGNVLLDPSGGAFSLYRVSAIPETFVVDAKGIIYRDIVGWQGPASLTEFQDILRKVSGP